MKLIVISDTHGRRGRIKDVLSLRDLDGEALSGLAAVRGNCDGFSLFSPQGTVTERMLCFDEFRILMMHGHEHNVKSGTDRAIAHAAAKGADILLYGHTHVREEKYYPEGTLIGGVTLERPLWVFNPGSLGQPSDGISSYGIIEIRNGSVLFSHGTV